MSISESVISYKKRYNEELFDSCIPFWLEHGPDAEHGGIFTCLDRVGKITSHDKGGWMQGRTAWTYSRMCNQYGVNEDWLSLAKSCLEFARRHFIDPADGRMYFITTREGAPVRKRRYTWTETFYAMGNAECYRATGNDDYLQEARRVFDFLAGQYDGEKDPFYCTPKYMPARQFRSFGGPMIGIDVCGVMLLADPERADLYKSRIRKYVDDIFKYFYKEDMGCILEHAGPNGEFLSDWTVGRELNPGHGLEGVWFLAKASETLGDPEILAKAERIYRFCLDRGWDEEYGGVYLFVDALGFPPEKYEHDMKMWWGINETICAALVLYEMTGKVEYWKDFVRFSDYYFDFFSDRKYGCCFGYLRRDGKPTEPIAKGNIYKGPFHNPRMLMLADKLLGELAVGD